MALFFHPQPSKRNLKNTVVKRSPETQPGNDAMNISTLPALPAALATRRTERTPTSTEPKLPLNPTPLPASPRANSTQMALFFPGPHNSPPPRRRPMCNSCSREDAITECEPLPNHATAARPSCPARSAKMALFFHAP